MVVKNIPVLNAKITPYTIEMCIQFYWIDKPRKNYSTKQRQCRNVRKTGVQ